MRNLVGIVYHATHVSQLFYVLVAHVSLNNRIQPSLVQINVIRLASLFRLILNDVLFLVVVAHFVVMVATFIFGKLRPPTNSAGADAAFIIVCVTHMKFFFFTVCETI